MTDSELAIIANGIGAHLEKVLGVELSSLRNDMAQLGKGLAISNQQVHDHLMMCESRHQRVDTELEHQGTDIHNLLLYQAQQGNIRDDVDALQIINAKVLGILLGIALVGGAGGGVIVRALGG